MLEDGLTSINRLGYLEDIAKVVMNLCSGIFIFSIGEVINVDGDFHLRSL
jgi:hypothetical protein